MPVCVPITAYPMPGGMRAVMRSWRLVMNGIWTMRFFTRTVGPDHQGENVQSFELRWRLFGPETSSPHQFPNVLFYVSAGARNLRKALRQEPAICLLLPQDGLFSAAFAGVVGHRAGVRVVSMDHGNIHALYDPIWYREQVDRLRRFGRLKRSIAYLRLRCYWPMLKVLARRAVRHTDAFLVASDQGAEDYQRHLGVPSYKIARVPWVVDTERIIPLAGDARAAARQRFSVPPDALLISMVNRLGPEKGLHVAAPALGRLYAALPDALRGAVRVVIAGDGPLRQQVEEDIRRLGLQDAIRLWGMATPDEVAALLGASDIFLYTGVRDSNPMTLVEAMAAGCASVGTASTPHVAMYYAEGRGVTVPVGDVDAIATALSALVRDDTARASMGVAAREYVQTHHTAEVARRVLLRASFYESAVPVLAAINFKDVTGSPPSMLPASEGAQERGSGR
jgi:glycosyltransferase involved in cell wall biosynthesis